MKAADLFAGLGGFTEGAEAAGSDYPSLMMTTM
jgi:site-specific DNA-cytosine methylase